MKILFLNLYSQKIHRGAESFTHELIEQIKPYHQVQIIKGDSDLQPSSQFSGNIFSKLAKRLFLDKPGRQVLIFSLSCIPQILKHNYQVIVPLNGFWQLLMLKLLQPFKGFKIVVVGHSGPGWDERWNLYLHPNRFIATTPSVAQWAKQNCFWTNVTMIPYGIDVQKFKTSSQQKVLPPPVILCPAALVPYKNIDLAIKAVSQIPQGNLLIAGNGPLKAQLEALGKKLLGTRFKIIYVPYKEMPAIFASAAAITLPSSSQENAPLAILEALAAHKPVVTTDTPRTRWILEEEGIFIDPHDTNQYAQALAQALKQKPTTPAALNKFTWESVLPQYLDLLDTL